MKWQAPMLDHLLEERLRVARIELMEDVRIQDAMNASGAEAPGFILQLVDEKIAAAAKSGLNAVEASLRVAATDALLESGVPLEVVRDKLRQAGEIFLAPPGPRSLAITEVALTPLGLAAGVFVVWTGAALALFFIVAVNPVVLAVIVAAGILPAYATRRWRERNAAALKQRMAHEFPARICRHFMQVMHDGVDAYELTVRELQERYASLSRPPLAGSDNGRGHTFEETSVRPQ